MSLACRSGPERMEASGFTSEAEVRNLRVAGVRLAQLLD